MVGTDDNQSDKENVQNKAQHFSHNINQVIKHVNPF
jgi:hypothetical protein